MKFTGNLLSKLPRVKTTIFTKMSELSAAHNAINLAQGFPDFEVDPKLFAFAFNAMDKGLNQYAPMIGLQPLREKIVEKIENSYSAIYHPEKEITITAGATQAIFTTLSAIVQEGDEVIVFDPSYDCYAPAIELNRGIPIHVALNEKDFSIPWNNVKKVISSRTKAIIINTPHNPSGSVWSAADMLQLQKITENSDILIISDEVYEHIIYDGLEHQSVTRYPLLAERSFVIASFGKTFHVTGWKIGYVLAPENLMLEFRKVHQYNVFSVNAPSQFAFSEMFEYPEFFNQISEFYQQKRDFFSTALKSSRFKLLPVHGTYFQVADFSNISDEKEENFAIRITQENGVSGIPLSVFYNSNLERHHIRFCFAKKQETLEKALEKLVKL